MPQRNRRISGETRRTKQGKFVEFHDGRKAVYHLGAGDTYYMPNFIKSRRKKTELFQQLLHEVDFQQMFNFGNDTVETIPRMIAAQTDKSNPVSLVYRMPGCNQANIPTTQWTETVKTLVDDASHEIGQELNHCVLTLYRDEDDSLAFHQDKIIDLQENSQIISLSFGEPRPIVFAEIDGRRIQTIMLQPGSLLVFGSRTNSRFRHSIPKLKESVGPRISLSVRTICTMIEQIDDENFVITGQGEEHQTRNYPFVKSYDDKSEFTDEVKQLIETLHDQKQEELEHMRSRDSDSERALGDEI